MTYRPGMRDSGWEIVDTISRSVAIFGGLRMERLTGDEAHIMAGMLEAYDRGIADEAADEGEQAPAPPRRN